MLHTRTRLFVTSLLLALILPGCAMLSGRGGDTASGKSSAFGKLYTGDTRLARAAGDEHKTAAQAIADGDRALALGDFDQALYEYVQALETNGGDAATLNKIAAIQNHLGHAPLAARAYALSLHFKPGNPEALEGIGLLLLRERQYDSARTELEAALKADPKRWRSLNGLGMLDDLAGDHAAAAGRFRKALAIPGADTAGHESAQLWNNLGYSLYMSGDLQGALQNFYTAIDKDPAFKRAWENIGLVYTRMGDYDRALDAYQRVMDKPEAYNNVGYVCMINDRYDLAEHYFRQAIDLSPTYYVKAHDNLERLNTLRSSAANQTATRSPGPAVAGPAWPAKR